MTSTTTDRLAGVNAALAVKAPVRCATTANITLSGAQTIDGISAVADDRVLVKDQTDGTENGIYYVASGAWVRAKDFDGIRDVVSGTLVNIAKGTAGEGLIYRLSTADTITIGTTSLTFTLVSVATASAFMLTLLDDASKEAAQVTLDVASLTDANTFAGAQTDSAARVFNALVTHNSGEVHKKGTDIASGTPTVPADGIYYDVTGTTTITAFTVAAGTFFVTQFDGALQLTHHATNLDLPSEANITTAAGDVALWFATGANTCQCISFTTATGVPLVVAAGDFEFVATTAITGDPTALTITSMEAGYDYIIQLEAAGAATDSEILEMVFSFDNSTYIETASAYEWSVSRLAGPNASTGDTEIQLTGDIGVGNDANSNTTMKIDIANPGNADEYTVATWAGTTMSDAATPVLQDYTGAAFIKSATSAVQAVKFQWGGATAFKNQGDYTVYRRKRS
jgi:hypothetical protein